MNEPNLIFKQPTFEEKAQEVRIYIVDYIMDNAPEMAEQIVSTVNNPGSLMSLMIEALAAYDIDRTRKLNTEANELSRLTVKSDSGVDRLVANTGLKRAVLKAATETEVAVMESNDSLLTRFDLSHYQANTTGTRYGYKFHCLCYGVNERPSISVVKDGNKIIQTFTYSDSFENNIADAEFRTTAPGTGKVVGAITPKEGATVDRNGLLEYMKRADIAQETDILTTKLASARNYSVTINAYTKDDPRFAVSAADITREAQALIKAKRRNEARVSSHDFSHIVKSLGAYDVDIIGLDTPVVCEWDEYPECLELIVNVLGKR